MKKRSNRIDSKKTAEIRNPYRDSKSKDRRSIKMIMKANLKASCRGNDVEHRVGKNCYRNYKRACNQFDQWRKLTGISNNQVKSDPYTVIRMWRDSLMKPVPEDMRQLLTLRYKQDRYSEATIKVYIAGVCCGLNISMDGIAKVPSALDKTKNYGSSECNKKALEKPENQNIRRFAEMVGGRRSAYSRLTGADFVKDESGYYCVRFIKDKGGKDQLQRIAPENLEEVRSYFEMVNPDDKLFPQEIDKELPLHYIRALHARQEYERYKEICSTQQGREQMRHELWSRYHDPVIGCKAYLMAKKNGNQKEMKRLDDKFLCEMKDGIYHVSGDNRRAAILHDRPTEYDRLALCCVSVFALSHWRNEVTIKNYMI